MKAKIQGAYAYPIYDQYDHSNFFIVKVLKLGGFSVHIDAKKERL
jgi:hypothetical protein